MSTLSNKTTCHGYHETKQHIEFMFPYNVYLCTIPDDFSSVFLHWQDTMEIIYIKKGAGTAQVDLRVFEVHAGDIIFIPPGHLHGLTQLRGQRMEYENIIFDLTFLGSAVIDICSQKYLLPILNEQITFPVCLTPKDHGYTSISQCLDTADTLCDCRTPGYELGVKSSLMRLFSLLFQYGMMEEISASSAPQNLTNLKETLNYLESNYRHHISIHDAALICGYSESHFMRWFKEMTGTSFIQYLNRYRLEKAFDLLKTSDKTILEISSEVGFDNLSNFNRLFKKHFGTTPRSMRKSFPSGR